MARVKIHDHLGREHYARVLLDCGFQSSFISLSLCKRLGLKQENTNLSVVGIANITSQIKKRCQVEIKSLYKNFKLLLNCFILPEVTNISSSRGIHFQCLGLPKNVQLADPDYNKPGPVDILVGADIFWILLGKNRISCGKHMPFLQETDLGYVLAGMVGHADDTSSNISCHLSTNAELQNTISKFWEIEEIPTNKVFSEDELKCESIFSQTTHRDASGRFVVTLPFKQSPNLLGSSREQAEKRP
ncbi:uncharacterized protein LOC115876317 [Sitophilus oryzae]|uniref:Uncharacterized protein LOC115876317 n=1 Tax=Sitophilus oryzae TaxID=7048 RepID=A0A6J2X9P8_SITOR|nr:uncharacterized protein LOC115876317 [Sitophilus oryzae]